MVKIIYLLENIAIFYGQNKSVNTHFNIELCLNFAVQN